MIRRRVVVHGLVQGVFFRDSCQRQATKRGVAGWVRNRYDDTVEAVFEGEADAVEQMINWCRSGPSRAHVTQLDVMDEPVQGDTDFDVR